MPVTRGHVEAGHVDLILQQIESLPTLSSVAVRVLALTEQGDTDLRELAQLIESDPSMTAKLLALCRKADRAAANKVTTVDRAVVMLGLEAVRAALLSVEIFDAFENDEKAAPGERIDRSELWRHSIAVACTAELLAESRPALVGGFRPQEAFLAGLLHDLGKIALDRILPKAFARVASICERQQMNIAEVERRVLGIDHHVAGKRLAEHWGLPHALQDVVWLNGQPFDSLPDMPHRGLVGVVTIAAAIVKRLHLGWSGDFGASRDFGDLCREHGYDPEEARRVTVSVHERVAQRAKDLGLDEETDRSLLLRSLARANERLGRMAALLERRATSSTLYVRTLESVSAFHTARKEALSMSGTMAAVLRSAQAVLGEGFYAVLMQTRDGAPWSVQRLDSEGEPATHWLLKEPPEGRDVSELLTADGVGVEVAPLLQWLSEALTGDEVQAGELRILPLAGGDGGLSAVLIHTKHRLNQLVSEPGSRSLAQTWGAAIASAAQHDGARRMGERLAEVNRELTETQTKLVEAQSLARLGELAAGAAHEMNNPLTVISGNAQLLARRLRGSENSETSQLIVEASEKLTELITSLHLFAEPPRPQRHSIDVMEMLKDASKNAREREGGTHGVRVVQEGPIPPAFLDDSQIAQAVTELILNALEHGPRRNVEVRAHIDSLDGRLIIAVADDGNGMSEHALKHAFDPFFSELPAGRRSGLGLTRARRFVDLHGGELVLESKLGRGTVARIALPDWREPAEGEQESRAA